MSQADYGRKYIRIATAAVKTISTIMFNLIHRLLKLKIGQLSAAPPDTSCDRLFQCIRSIREGSDRITTWCLSIAGGTLLTILSNEFLQMDSQKFKYIYLLFIPGWLFMAFSLYNGRMIVGRSIASDLHREDRQTLRLIFEQCNRNYSGQLLHFNISLVIFGIWLVLYLVWWILGEKIECLF